MERADEHRRTRSSRGLYAAALWAALIIAACGSDSAPASPTNIAPAPQGGINARVLMLTATAGFRHDSIPTAMTTMRSLGAAGGFTVDATENLSSLNVAALAPYDVIMFAMTSGELPLTPDQQSALIGFVQSGRGFIGVHSATDTLYEWPDYGRLVGAYFKEHPWTQRAIVVVEDPSHPSMMRVPSSFTLMEEFYTFRENPRGRVQVLMRLDAASVGAAGDYPLAWAQPFGSGRAYYNALGHFPETWRDDRFQQQMTGAVRWAAGR